MAYVCSLSDFFFFFFLFMNHLAYEDEKRVGEIKQVKRSTGLQVKRYEPRGINDSNHVDLFISFICTCMTRLPLGK